MDGGSGSGRHFVRARLVLVAALVLLVVIVPVQRAGAVGAQTVPASGVAVTVTGPGLGWPSVETPSAGSAVGRPLSSPSRGGEDRRPVLARAGARPTAEHARITNLDHELLARFD